MKTSRFFMFIMFIVYACIGCAGLQYTSEQSIVDQFQTTLTSIQTSCGTIVNDCLGMYNENKISKEQLDSLMLNYSNNILPQLDITKNNLEVVFQLITQNKYKEINYSQLTDNTMSLLMSFKQFQKEATDLYKISGYPQKIEDIKIPSFITQKREVI